MNSIALLCMMVGLFFPLAPWAGETGSGIAEYSADVIKAVQNADAPVAQGRMYVSRYGIRTEGTKGSQRLVHIFRPSQEVVWTLYPDHQLFDERVGLVVERPPLPSDPHSPCQQPEGETVCQSLGNETVQGRLTDHWLISKQMAGKWHPVVQLWVDPALHVALREKFPDGTTVELRNVVEGSQKEELFQVPVGYAKRPLPERKQERTP